MPAKEILPDLFEDDDTYRLLDITLVFLNRYFGHSGEKAEALMKDFFSNFRERFGEDDVHHESSYRMAAITHYLSYLKQNPNELGDWLVSTGHNKTPPEALEYYREHYFL